MDGGINYPQRNGRPLVQSREKLSSPLAEMEVKRQRMNVLKCCLHEPQILEEGGDVLAVHSVQTLDSIFQSAVDRPPFSRFGLVQLAAEDSLTVVALHFRHPELYVRGTWGLPL
jgi:hypothetical protein